MQKPRNPIASLPVSNIEAEQTFVSTFVTARKRNRWAESLHVPATREKITRQLSHLRDLGYRFMTKLPDNISTSGIVQCLISRCSPDHVFIISESRSLDRKTMPLPVAIDSTIGMRSGTIIICIPDKLAYYEGEGPSERFIIAKDNVTGLQRRLNDN